MDDLRFQDTAIGAVVEDGAREELRIRGSQRVLIKISDKENAPLGRGGKYHALGSKGRNRRDRGKCNEMGRRFFVSLVMTKGRYGHSRT